MPAGAGSQPTGRPYGSPDDLDGNSGRQGEFLTGYAGAGDIAGNSSIITNSTRWNARTPRQVGLSSVMQTALPSANGMSESDAQRMVPTANPGRAFMLPSQTAAVLIRGRSQFS